MKNDSKLLIDDRPLMVLPKLVMAIGLNEAIIIQQIHYWIKLNERAKSEQHNRDGRWWVYNTAKDWQENFPWMSLNTVRRALKRLRDLGLVLTANYNQSAYDHTLWYTIDYEALELANLQTVPPADESDKPGEPEPSTQNELQRCNQKGNIIVPVESKPIPEITSEITHRDNSPTAHDDEASSAGKRQRGRPPAPQNEIRRQLEQHFSSVTGLPQPKASSVAEKRSAGALWWAPLREIAELCAWDSSRATQLIDATLAHLRGTCTIASPKSILATARAAASGNVPGLRLSRAGPRTEIMNVWDGDTQQWVEREVIL
jgi:hypothetical protein